MKTTRTASLTVVMLSLIIGPAAMASWCYRCKIVPLPNPSYCIEHTSTQFLGWTECYNDETGCFVSGDRCYGQVAQLSTPLTTEYAVASVERLDEPRTAEAGNRVADATPAAR